MNVKTPCAKPPGFSITCNHTQLAICGTVNGEVVMGCFDPPPPSSAHLSNQGKTLELENWAIQRITGETRTSHQYVAATERSVLQNGFYRNPRTFDEVRFRMPSEEEEETPQGAQMARW